MIDAEMTTPSTVSYTSEEKPGTPYRRTGAQGPVVYENGVVTHWPLWFEDPFENVGNDFNSPDQADIRFAWNWMDYAHMMGYGPARFTIETVGWPIFAGFHPPGLLMESDARADRGPIWPVHDPHVADRSRREPPDEAMARFHPPQDDQP